MKKLLVLTSILLSTMLLSGCAQTKPEVKQAIKKEGFTIKQICNMYGVKMNGDNTDCKTPITMRDLQAFKRDLCIYKLKKAGSSRGDVSCESVIKTDIKELKRWSKALGGNSEYMKYFPYWQAAGVKPENVDNWGKIGIRKSNKNKINSIKNGRLDGKTINEILQAKKEEKIKKAKYLEEKHNKEVEALLNLEKMDLPICVFSKPSGVTLRDFKKYGTQAFKNLFAIKAKLKKFNIEESPKYNGIIVEYEMRTKKSNMSEKHLFQLDKTMKCAETTRLKVIVDGVSENYLGKDAVITKNELRVINGLVMNIDGNQQKFDERAILNKDGF